MRPVSAGRVASFLATALALGCSAYALRPYLAASAEFHPRHVGHDVPTGLARDYGMHAVRFVAPIDGHSVKLSAWYAASRNGATVIFVHGTNSDRAGLIDDASILLRGGFGALLLDLPGHGESDGDVHWNESEAAALVSAARWLADLHQHVGVFGFSMGGVVASRAARLEPKIEALVLAATPARVQDMLRAEFGGRTGLGYLPARLAYAVGGADLEHLPIDDVRRMAPRPLLVVTANADPVVPLSLTQELYASAPAPKQLLVTQARRHGGYARDDRAYPETLVSFFDHALVAH